MAAVNRTILGKWLDRFFAWRKGLPAERCNYSIQDLKVPIDSKTKVTAKLYLPLDRSPLGTILIRTPYGIGLLSSLALARIWAARGYQVLLSSCRGTSGSEGESTPGVNEVADGATVVSWMREQKWYSGSFATLGGSYLGYNQWALLHDPPIDMKAAIIHTGVYDFHDLVWGSGAFASLILAWADITTLMNRGKGLLSLIFHLRSQNKRLSPVYNSAPLLDAVDTHFENNPPTWLRGFITSSESTDEVWKGTRQGDALLRANIPILLTAGWDDIILPQVMVQYSSLVKRNCPVALTVGPWTHLGAQRQCELSDTLAWLDQHLAGMEDQVRRTSVRVHVTGAKEWRELPKWPPPSQPSELFLREGGQLAVEPPSTNDLGSTTVTFDPADPTPSVGYPLLFDNGPGRAGGDSILATRKDVFTFTTEPLERDVEICGQAALELYHSTSTPHADLLVLLSDVDGKGKSRSISEKYLRLPLDRAPGSLHVTLTDCAHRFRRGNRIRLYIAGGFHPRYIRNSGTGKSVATGVDLQEVQHTIQHSPPAVSKLVLPMTSSTQ